MASRRRSRVGCPTSGAASMVEHTMKSAVVIPYENICPKFHSEARLEPWAAAIGRLQIGERLTLLKFATVRADGEHISIGHDCWFAERSTVHIADGERGTVIANRVSVGRYAVVHACTVGDDCIIGDGAVVMDGATIGSGVVIAAGALVPPRKNVESGWLYSGAPAVPIRRVDKEEHQELKRKLIEGAMDSIVCSGNLPALDADRLIESLNGEPPLYRRGDSYPDVSGEAYVAPTAVLAGRVVLETHASVWFGTVLDACSTEIRIGRRTNVQDNCIVDSRNGPVVVGDDVTFGHNVRLSSARIGDGALIGIGSSIGEGSLVERGACVAAGAIVEPGTVVREGYIWAGRPAREFRQLRREEREHFQYGNEAYTRYLRAYRQYFKG